MPIPLWAGRYIGVPFSELGRDWSGVECWGLVRLVFCDEFKVILPSFLRRYEHTRDCEAIGRLVLSEIPTWQKIESGAEQLGDVVVLRVRGQPMHVGIVLGDQSMLHVESGINSTIENYRSARWADRLFGFYRYQ